MSDLPNPQIRSGKEGIGLVAPHQLLIHEYQDDGDSNKGIVKDATNGSGEYLDLTNQMTLVNNNRFALINYFDGTTSVVTNINQNISITKLDGNITLNGIEEKSTLRIYDISGKQVITLEIEGTTKTISLNGMNKGIYFLKIDAISGHNQYIRKLTI